MRASVILAHPHPGSFNHGIFDTIRTVLDDLKVDAWFHDLYKEGFSPLLTEAELGSDRSDDALVTTCTSEMMASDLVFFVHPNWWGQPPAILKGYIDRVFRPPHAYDFPGDDSGGGLPVTGLDGKYGIVFNTSNTAKDREDGCFGDPLENIWRKCIFGFCGIDRYHRRMFRIIADSSEADRRAWLEEVDADVRRIAAEQAGE